MTFEINLNCVYGHTPKCLGQVKYLATTGTRGTALHCYGGDEYHQRKGYAVDSQFLMS